jgi:hypothetical protein
MMISLVDMSAIYAQNDNTGIAEVIASMKNFVDSIERANIELNKTIEEFKSERNISVDIEKLNVRLRAELQQRLKDRKEELEETLKTSDIRKRFEEIKEEYAMLVNAAEIISIKKVLITKESQLGFHQMSNAFHGYVGHYTYEDYSELLAELRNESIKEFEFSIVTVGSIDCYVLEKMEQIQQIIEEVARRMSAGFPGGMSPQLVQQAQDSPPFDPRQMEMFKRQ